MITPVTAAGLLDEPAAERLVEFLISGGVEGVFVLGTTGEAAAVPRPFRRRLVELVAARARGRTLVYAGLGDPCPEAVADGNEFLRAGADVIVSRPAMGQPSDQLLPWFQSLLKDLNGPLIIYSIPLTTKVSIPLDVVGQLLGHPKLAGIKDSENNAKRLTELLERFGGRPGFSIFVGVGALMAQGLKLGAAGIVPSVGNLIPDVCHNLCAAARRGDWAEAERHFSRMNAVSAMYQNGRTLGESLAVLKAAMHCRQLCGPHMLPPLRLVPERDLDALRLEMTRLQLLNGT